jgi:hypothetical protein
MKLTNHTTHITAADRKSPIQGKQPAKGLPSPEMLNRHLRDTIYNLSGCAGFSCEELGITHTIQGNAIIWHATEHPFEKEEVTHELSRLRQLGYEVKGSLSRDRLTAKITITGGNVAEHQWHDENTMLIAAAREVVGEQNYGGVGWGRVMLSGLSYNPRSKRYKNPAVIAQKIADTLTEWGHPAHVEKAPPSTMGLPINEERGTPPINYHVVLDGREGEYYQQFPQLQSPGTQGPDT